MTKEQKAKSLEEQIADEIAKLGLSGKETKTVLQNLRDKNPRKYKPVRIDYAEDTVKFGYITDLHMGHNNYRPDILRHFAKRCKAESVDFVVNTGDTIEGMSGREGHVYELSHIGASSQLDYFEKEMKVLKDFDVYSIEAQDSHSGWFHNKGNAGWDIGPELERRAPNYKFIGYDEQDLEVDNGLVIRLRHPGGGTAYAISYKMQKYVESITGGDKPNIVLQGHFHKANYLFYRNIHCFDGGALQEQSPFMKKKGSPSHIGYWIIEATTRKNGEKNTRVKAEWTPFYD